MKKHVKKNYSFRNRHQLNPLSERHQSTNFYFRHVLLLTFFNLAGMAMRDSILSRNSTAEAFGKIWALHFAVSRVRARIRGTLITMGRLTSRCRHRTSEHGNISKNVSVDVKNLTDSSVFLKNLLTQAEYTQRKEHIK